MTNIIGTILRLFGFGKAKEPVVTSAAPERTVYAGPQVISNAKAIFLHHNDNVALVVDHEFEDVPSWIEWDLEHKKLTVAQMGGTLTELDTMVPDNEMEDYKIRKKMYLIANYGGEKIIHHLAFIIRDS